MFSQRTKSMNLSTSLLSVTSSQTNLLRDELEDKFFRLKEEHSELKKEANNAENQMKYLNAKLTRLLNEKKRLLNKEKTRREIDLEELIIDLQKRLSQMDRENNRLRDRTLVLKTQLDTQMGKRGTGGTYTHIRSRTDSGLGTNFRHTRSSSALVLNRRPITTESTVSVGEKQRTSSSSMPSFAFNLLQEAQEEIQKLEEVVAVQQSHIEALQLQTERLRQLTNNSNTNNNLKNSLVNTSMTLKTTIDRTDISQNFSESNGYSKPETEFKEKYLKHKQLVNQKSNGKRVNEEINNLIEKLQNELSIERTKCSELRRKVVEDKALQNGHKELEQRIQTLEKENEILRQSLDSCIGSCITEIKQNGSESDPKRDVEYERELQMQISGLTNELTKVQNELRYERDKYQTLYAKHENLETMYSEVKLQLQRNESSIRSTNQSNSGNQCNRSDHLELSQHLEAMQSERQQLLAEFEDMKQMLQSIEISITSDSNQ